VWVPLSFYHTVKYALGAYGEYGTKLCMHLTLSKVSKGLRKMVKKEICAGGATKNINKKS